MKIMLSVVLWMFVLAGTTNAQTQNTPAKAAKSPSEARAQLKVVAGLTAEDGTVRFMPRVKVQIVRGRCPTDGTETKAMAVAEGETSLHGELLVVLPQGAYRLCAADTTTPKHYRWNLPVAAKGKPLTVELSDGNALRATTTSATSSAKGVIEGDVYLLMRSGDVRKGAGLAVHLIRDPDAVSALLTANCDQYRPRYADLEHLQTKRQQEVTDNIGRSTSDFQQALDNQRRAYGQMTELFDSTTASADRILLAASLTSVNSGVNAHFKFENVPAGSYGLWTQFPIGEHSYQWFIPLRLVAGQHLVRDLDTDSMNREVVYCGIK